MPRVMLKCPKTGQDVAMGMSTDAESFATLQVNRARVKCAACGEDHVVERKDLFLESPQNPFQR